jgi:hypothetical protein
MSLVLRSDMFLKDQAWAYLVETPRSHVNGG